MALNLKNPGSKPQHSICRRFEGLPFSDPQLAGAPFPGSDETAMRPRTGSLWRAHLNYHP